MKLKLQSPAKLARLLEWPMLAPCLLKRRRLPYLMYMPASEPALKSRTAKHEKRLACRWQSTYFAGPHRSSMTGFIVARSCKIWTCIRIALKSNELASGL